MRKVGGVLLGVMFLMGVLTRPQVQAQDPPLDSPSAVGSETDPQVILHVFNYARVSPRHLAKGEDVAGRILSHAGLEVRWINYFPGPDGRNIGAGCQDGCGPANLFLSILPPEKWAKLHHRNNYALGFAAVPEEGGRGSVAYISWSEIEEESQWVGLGHEEDDVLGCVMTHEIGHLLLRTGRHTPTGIMRAIWGHNQMHRATEGALRFTPAQAALLRAEAASRAQGTLGQTATLRQPR